MDVHLFSRDHDFADQALGDGLLCFKRELFQVLTEQLAKGRRIVDHLLPMDTLLARLCSLLTFLLDLLHGGSEFLSPCLKFMQGNNIGLIGIEQTLVLPLKPLPPLHQLRLLRLKPGEVVLLSLRPSLMQAWDHAWMPQ